MTEARDADSASIVRPYARTRGRTGANLNLPLETLIVTTSLGSTGDRYGSPEHQDIATLCQEVRSVAEVAALIAVPIGVARVLIADMAGMGLVTVLRGAPQQDGAPDLALLERVLSGLRRL